MLIRLLEHPSAAIFDITVLVRDGSKAKTLESQFGVKAVLGTHQDLDKIERLIENAHAVFHLVCMMYAIAIQHDGLSFLPAARPR